MLKETGDSKRHTTNMTLFLGLYHIIQAVIKHKTTASPGLLPPKATTAEEWSVEGRALAWICFLEKHYISLLFWAKGEYSDQLSEEELSLFLEEGLQICLRKWQATDRSQQLNFVKVSEDLQTYFLFRMKFNK